MYEKPQYLTPDGYRRMPARPEKIAGRGIVTSLQAKKDVAARKMRLEKLSAKGKSISPEAARIIAMALKSMLKQK